MNLLVQVRDDYIRLHRPRTQAEAIYSSQGPFAERVRRAALAATPSGKHKHQWRIPPEVLMRFAERLRDRLENLAAARSFAQLLTIVESARTKGVGKLTIYDTTFRIAQGLGLAPTEVFLHAGTREGARRLGWNVRRPSIPRKDLPAEWANLSSSEIEDLLCIYARYFGAKGVPFAPRQAKGCGSASVRPAHC